MKTLVQSSIAWIEHRTGLQSAIGNFFSEDVAAGWAQVFGSVALFLFLNQALTGILLAFNYSPTPGEAYNSVTYITREVAGGRMMRGLHHWGATLMIVVVVLHMCQVFVYGAYKKPREVTWCAGVFLFLLTLAFGLTGYLLPWDNRAYWGTVVTAHLLDQVPLGGAYLRTLIGAADNIGALTFSRFYALHTMVLPSLMVLLTIMHVALVRRHGTVAGTPDAIANQKFYPQQAFRDVIAVFIAFVILFISAALIDVPLEQIADPTDQAYIPRPEWYFLFLFQSLKYFHGSLEVVGSVGLPAAAILTLFAVPFIDRGHVRKVSKRIGAMAVVALGLGGWGALTAAAVASTPSASVQSPSDAGTLNKGAELYVKSGCASCHQVNGAGGRIGPSLNGLAQRRSKEWVEKHFAAPTALSPGSVMPPYHFAKEEQDAIVAYLFSLPR